MNILFIGVGIFVLTLFVIELTAWAVRIIQHPDRAEVRRRLKRSMLIAADDDNTDITRKKILSDLPFLNHVLAAMPGVDRLDLLMRQADVKYTMGFFLLLSAALGLSGYLVCFVLTGSAFFALLLAVGAASLPLVTLRTKKNKRMARFEKQLPEALGLISRALRAGHAFASGMKLAAEEFAEPLGPEFAETLDEINFGVSVPEALKNLARRVDCPDVNFFVVAVILQRETGGNLAEIIDNLAHLMRERFKFRGKVRILTAEGRLTGKILVAIPVIVFVALYLVNPDYAGVLVVDPIGRTMAGAAIVLMIVGGLVIRRILKLDV